MGYESKLFIVNRNEYVAETIAEFDLCRMPYEFGKYVFRDKIDFDICVNDELTRADKYGDTCRVANIPDVIRALEQMKEKENYRRLAPCIGLLKGFRPEEWDDLKVVHYGY